MKVNHGAKGISNAKKIPTKIKNSIGLNPNIKENIYQRERECTEKTHTKIVKTNIRIVPILESVKNRRVFGIQVSSATTIDKINNKYFFILIISL